MTIDNFGRQHGRIVHGNHENEEQRWNELIHEGLDEQRKHPPATITKLRHLMVDACTMLRCHRSEQEMEDRFSWDVDWTDE